MLVLLRVTTAIAAVGVLISIPTFGATPAVAPPSFLPIPINRPGARQPGTPATLQPGEWCDTHIKWVEKTGGRGGTMTGVCPTLGRCDEPTTRDAHIPDAATPFKTIPLHTIVFTEDNGSNPAATEEDIRAQMEQLNADYRPHRIRFVQTFRFERSSAYRQLADDAEIDAMKRDHAWSPEKQCNVFVADLTGGLLGRGTFPWDTDALTALGGVIVDDGAFGAGQKTMTHEIGHNLGLWHTHHGVTEQDYEPCGQDGDPCDCPCYERADGREGDITGDFALQTPPTPVNYNCAPPGGTDRCSITDWGRTQYENYMGYAPDSCYSVFTAQQAGRMHCWIGAALSTYLCEDTQEVKLVAADGGEFDHFGSSVSLFGNSAAVGAPGNQHSPINFGSVYVLHYDGLGWGQEDKLRLNESWEEGFGTSVSLDAECVLVGSPHLGSPDFPGWASIFRYSGTTWVQEAKLLAGDATEFDWFGRSVSLSSGKALIGAPHAYDSHGAYTGAAYVFRHDGSRWVQEAKLLAADGTSGDQFGHSVSLSDNTALVTAPYDGEHGAAYVFRHNGAAWVQEVKLEGEPRGLFGWAAALSGDFALVGAPYDDDGHGAYSGSSYVFHYNGSGWVREAKLSASDAAANDRFGWSVSLSGHTSVIGAYLNDDHGEDSGSAYVFRYNGSSWSQESKLLASDGAANDRLGLSVSASGDMSLIGAPRYDDRGAGPGSAYVDTPLAPDWEPDCNGNQNLDVCDIAGGASEDRNGDGIPDECGDCTRNERIGKAKCKNSNGVNKMTVALSGGNGALPDTFTLTLSSGETKSGTLASDGSAKAKFKNLPSGPGTAMAEWGCGATDSRAYECP